MSWRFIFVILLVAAGASAWGGIRLGDWLVAHGPVAPVIEEPPELSTVPVLDANGLPYVAQPPQPLMNGQLGVPSETPQIAWEIPAKSLDETKSNSTIALATTTITMDEAVQIAASGNQGFHGIADVGDLGLGDNGYNVAQQGLQPIEVAPPPPAPEPQPAAAPSNPAWQASLRQDLQACSAQSFFDRPSCAWAARNKYCEPNNAWGRTRDCPAKSF
ncbi:hypothetical protein EKL30_10615 [Candidimonas sp. SYP-B2681]|uniref:hypothetical protein n=1 Tax=Candidimonas sp. SYP-B2681 TaxID=2497686 RepID=UPI000F87BCBA|nr:hypothetical protein [Candidimonas sp. SYP-B2681]RTZ43318.1 hypothetical protein EKL30_10615 [Candidimonas sp. SYP-B2681]